MLELFKSIWPFDLSNPDSYVHLGFLLKKNKKKQRILQSPEIQQVCQSIFEDLRQFWQLYFFLCWKDISSII